MITNRTYRIARADIARAGSLLAAVHAGFLAEPLRWFVSSAEPDHVVVEATEYVGEPVAPPPVAAQAPASGKSVVLSLVPTGVGCEIGGYAGDAGPATALLAASADLVVTNPNAVNASNFIHAGDRVLYTEGYCIDRFAEGAVRLHRPRANRIGVVVEAAADPAVEHVLNLVNMARAVHGIDIVDVVVTKDRIGTRCVRNSSGAYGGTVDHPEVLLDAAARLVGAGATAIAVTTNVADLDPDSYTRHFSGEHPNPVGGAEAVLSHLIAKRLHVPAAHAPMVNFKELASPARVVDPRGAGEFVSASGLACVLIGLRRAPQIIVRPGCRIVESIGIEDVTAVVAPAGALGGIAVLNAVQRGILVIAVRQNRTVLDVTKDALRLDGVLEVDNYLEAAGAALAIRDGIALDTVRRPLAAIGAAKKGDEPR